MVGAVTPPIAEGVHIFVVVLLHSPNAQLTLFQGFHFAGTWLALIQSPSLELKDVNGALNLSAAMGSQEGHYASVEWGGERKGGKINASLDVPTL